jgi:hypothetical protein
VPASPAIRLVVRRRSRLSIEGCDRDPVDVA